MRFELLNRSREQTRNGRRAYLQTAIPHLCGALQAVPHLPQLVLLVLRLTHSPLQSDKPVGHVHIPFTQLVPPWQALPQDPQSRLLV